MQTALFARTSGFRCSSGDTGWVLPGTAASESGSDVAWSNPSNVLTDNTSYATAALTKNKDSNNLRVSNFGLSVPAAATIVGVEVAWKCATPDSNVRDKSILLVDASGSSGGSDNNAIFQNAPGTATEYSTGGATDTWGLSLTGADVNDSDFGVRIVTEYTGTGGLSYDYRMYFVKVKVYWDTCP